MVRKQYKHIDHTVVEAEIRRCPDCQAALDKDVHGNE
jgi:hypothetical protein